MSLKLIFLERTGVLSDLTSVLYQAGANIIEMASEIVEDGEKARVSLDIEIPKDDESYVDRLIERMQMSVPGFLEVEM